MTTTITTPSSVTVPGRARAVDHCVGTLRFSSHVRAGAHVHAYVEVAPVSANTLGPADAPGVTIERDGVDTSDGVADVLTVGAI